MKLTVLFIILVVSYCNLFAATYWVVPKGAALATGSERNPFPSVEMGLKKVGGGNTFIFKPGIYAGRQIMLLPEHAGKPQRPTILKSQYKYKATIHGSAKHNISILDGCEWVIIDGFDIGGARDNGILANADNTVIRNCWIHNNGAIGIGSHGHNNIVIENNLIEYNGHHPQYLHGIYIAGKSIIIRNNIIRYNSGCGLHLYPRIENSVIENNLIHANSTWGIALYSVNEGSNRIINNTIVQNGGGIVVVDGKNEIIANNIIWRNKNEVTASSTRWPDTAKMPIKLQGNYNLSNIKIDSNLCVPRSKVACPHGISVAPSFLDPYKGAFYLKKDSPAIGKGSKKFAPVKNFFGRSLLPDRAPDLGCFQYEPSLLLPQARESWLYQWPFFFKKSEGPIPDLWKLPTSKPHE